MARRLIITAGWLAAAVLAVLVGLVAISVIGDGLVSPLARPLNDSQVARELAESPPPDRTPDPSPSLSATSPPASTAPASISRPTRAGTVVASCTDGRGLVVNMSPAQGFTVHEQNGAEGEFRGVSDNHNRVKVRVSCAGDTPQIGIESRTD